MQTNHAGAGRRLTVAVVSHKPYRMPMTLMHMPLNVVAACCLTGCKATPVTTFRIGIPNTWSSPDCIACGRTTIPNIKALCYRRHFGSVEWLARAVRRDCFDRIIGSEETLQLLENTDIILPRRRNYYIESIYSHYAHTFDGKQLDVTQDIITERQPDYLSAFDDVMSSTRAHMFNMFNMRKDKLDEYCTRLFPILEELEKRIDDSGYDAFGLRYSGRISGRLSDVWLNTGEYKCVQLPVIISESVNWPKRCISFPLAKFERKKCGKGFE